MRRFLLLFLLLPALVFAQNSPSVVCSVDYYNATRYCGARNSARTTNGKIVVVFEPGSGYTNQDIWYVTYNPFFREWDPPQQLSQSTQNATGVPAVIADEDGNVFASWKEKNAMGRRDMMFARWDGYIWSTPVVADNIDNNAGVNTIDIASDGTIFNLFSIWDAPPAGEDYDANIYSSRSYDGGETWITDNLTSVFPTPDYVPFNWMDVNLAPGFGGTMYAVWEDKPEPVASSYEVVMSFFDGTSWSVPEIITPINDGTGVLKYVDGCTPRPEAQAIYEMGPDDYVLANSAAAIYYENSTSAVLSFFFNIKYIAPEANRHQLVAEVVNFLGGGTPPSILVVDDDNRYNHEEYLYASLDSAEISYDTFDCGDDGSGNVLQIPTADQLNNYDLVIWFAGDDGKGDGIWNGSDTLNTELKQYLDTAGKKMWLIGLDVLYDRYGKAPETFTAGDFCYDYLGIASYDYQSYADDGHQGVSQLDLVPGTSITTVDPIEWAGSGIRDGEPSIDSDSHGRLHLVYLHDKGSHILYKRYDGSDWTTPIQLDDTPDTVTVSRPNISIADNNGIYVIWLQRTSSQPLIYNVFYVTSNDGGNSWTTPVQLSECTYANSQGYSVKNATIGKKVRDAVPGLFDGGADVTWTEASPTAQYGYNIMYARIPYITTKVEEADGENIPGTFKLYPCYPNPFNANTMIQFSVPRKSTVTLEIFNITGEKIARLLHRKVEPGEYHIRWQANNQPSGTYIVRLKNNDEVRYQKIVLLK